MQHINKLPNPSEGTIIVDDFLTACWTGEEYIGANYDQLPKPSLRQFLLVEQKNLCCYCMKSLNDDHTTTLEHIAPHNCNKTEFDKYTIPVIVQNVIHQSLFIRTAQFVAPGLYPHDIAYHNLIVSCNSKSHCNNYRGDRFINCFFYDNLIVEKLEYDQEGNVFSSHYLDDLEIVGISINPLLILLRKIWFELAKTKESVEDVTEDDILEIVAEIAVGERLQRTINDFWGNPSKKADLFRYKWFFDYYKNKINNNN